MESGDIYPDILHSNHFQYHHNGWVYPHPVQLTFGDLYGHPPCRPVVKPLKGFL